MDCQTGGAVRAVRTFATRVTLLGHNVLNTLKVLGTTTLAGVNCKAAGFAMFRGLAAAVLTALCASCTFSVATLTSFALKPWDHSERWHFSFGWRCAIAGWGYTMIHVPYFVLSPALRMTITFDFPVNLSLVNPANISISPRPTSIALSRYQWFPWAGGEAGPSPFQRIVVFDVVPRFNLYGFLTVTVRGLG